MLRTTLNLGILAHVDAGKTTLTERLLYAAGVIDEIGSVDEGTTQTDSLELEQRRGITIKSAVVSFAIDDVTVNLIDTPGHPDFIAEVERVLNVLDGAVLVISAVEGVQPQTRVLMRALQRLGVPTLIFVNKIDRRGARYERVLESISERMSPAIVAMGSYARGELCPGSDVDVMLLHGGSRRGAPDADAVGALWYPLWHAGFVLGQSVRSVKEALAVADDDLETLTALLDVRLVAGEAALVDDLVAQAAHRLLVQVRHVVEHDDLAAAGQSTKVRIALRQHDAGPGACGRDGRADSGGPTADDQHIGFGDT